MAFTTPSFRTRAIIAAFVIAILILLLIPAVKLARRATIARVDRVNTPPAAPAPPPQSRVYNVGILISEYSAAGPTWMDKPYGVRDRFVVDVLRDHSINRIPLLEPDTENIPEIADVLHKNFHDAAWRNVDDPRALATLDVIVTANAVNVYPQTLKSIESAVENGVGLLRWQSLGDITPGFSDPTVLKLAAMTRAAYGSTNTLTDCTVFAPHAILGQLAKCQIVRLQASGAFGALVPGATPLIQIATESQVSAYAPGSSFDTQNLTFYPLYTAHLGKGKIISFPTPAFRELPSKFNTAIGENFPVRCVRWLADRSTTQPETHE